MMINNKRKLQLYASVILMGLLILMGFSWATHALTLYRDTIERQIAEDNEIVKDNLSIIIHQVTQQNTDHNQVIAQIQSILEVLQTKGWNGFACVLDKDGRVLAHPNRNMLNMKVPLKTYEPIDLLGTLSPPATQLSKTPDIARAVYKTSADIIAIGWLPELKTYLCVHKSHHPVTEKINALRNRLASIGFFVIAVAATLSWFFVGHLVDRYESHLSRSEVRNRTLVENSAPILIVLPTGELLDANPSAINLFGMERTALLSQNIQELWSKKHCHDLLAMFSLAPGKTKECHDLDLQTSTGSIIPADVRACAITYSDKEAIYLLIRDVTETRHAREEMLAANRRLKELDRLKTDFINTVSHELRTPLTSIRWSTDSLSKLISDGNETIQKLLKIIREDNQRLSGFIEELLNFSRIEAGKLKLALQEVNLFEVVQNVREEMVHLAQTKSLTIHPVSGSDTLFLHADVQHLRRVVANLLDNAIKYTPAHGTVTMHLSQNTTMGILEMTDSGIGIPPEDLPHIFEKFYRSDHLSVQKERGTGLGLAIVQSIVEAHNGSIHVKSVVGEGTTFALQLPLDNAPI